jgi:Integrase core domain
MEVTDGGQTATVRGAGVFDFQHQSGTLDPELPGVGKLPVVYVTVLVVNGVIYEKPPPWDRTGGKAWVRIGGPGARGGTRAAPGGSSLMANPSVDDSSRALQLLLGVGRVGTVRREVLDRMLILGGWQLVSVLAEYAEHYNVHRPHRALRQVPPLGLANQLWSCRPGGSCAEIDSVG